MRKNLKNEQLHYIKNIDKFDYKSKDELLKAHKILASTKKGRGYQIV